MTDDRGQQSSGNDPQSGLARRNRAVALALVAMVILLGVVSFFRMKGLTP